LEEGAPGDAMDPTTALAAHQRPAMALLDQIKAGAFLKPSRRALVRAPSLGEGTPRAWLSDVRAAPGLLRARSASTEEAGFGGGGGGKEGSPTVKSGDASMLPPRSPANLGSTVEEDESTALEELLKEAEQDIRLALASGASSGALDALDPFSSPTSPMSPEPLSPAPASPSNWASMEAATVAAVPATATEAAPDPALAKYYKMLSMHLPLGAVKQKMAAEGLDPSLLDTPRLLDTRGLAPFVAPQHPPAAAASAISSNPLLGEIHAAAARRNFRAAAAGGEQPAAAKAHQRSGSPPTVTGSDDPYLTVVALVAFLAEAESDAAATRKCLLDAEARYAELLAYFCEDPDLSVHDFFSPLQEFFQAFKAATAKIERRRAQELRAARGRSSAPMEQGGDGNGTRPNFIVKKKPLSAAEAAGREGAAAMAESQKP
jgi:hypothetical protein